MKLQCAPVLPWFLIVFNGGCVASSALPGFAPLYYRNVPTTYASEVPCDTCPLFHYVLNLYPDSTFHWRTSTGNGKTVPVSAYVDYGRWSVSTSENLLKLYAENDGQQRSLSILSSQRLETRAPDGSPTTWALSYLLTRQRRLDAFDVPFSISGAISFGDDGSALFTNCFPRRSSGVRETSSLDSIRSRVKRMHLPRGRSVHVSVSGFFFPVPKSRDVPDSLAITAVGDVGYQNGCREIYPQPRIGSVVWKLFELSNQSVEDSISVEMSVDTVEKSLSLRSVACNAAGRYREDRPHLIWFQAYDVVLDEGCGWEARGRLERLVNVMTLSKNYAIHADLLVLNWGDPKARFVAARFK